MVILSFLLPSIGEIEIPEAYHKVGMWYVHSELKKGGVPQANYTKLFHICCSLQHSVQCFSTITLYHQVPPLIGMLRNVFVRDLVVLFESEKTAIGWIPKREAIFIELIKLPV